MKKLVSIMGLMFLLVLLTLAVPTSNYKIVDLNAKFLLPSSEYWFGTDHLGRDIFSLMAQGYTRTLLVTIIASVVSYSIGVILGITSGFYGGWRMMLIRFLSDVSLIIPTFIVVLIISVIFNQSLVAVGLALGFSNIGVFANQAYELTIQALEDPYVDTLRMFGATNRYIMRHFLFPTLLTPTLNLMGNRGTSHILSYASLTFIGLGADITSPDFGTMLYQYRQYSIQAPWIILWPTLGIFILSWLFQLAFDEVTFYVND